MKNIDVDKALEHINGEYAFVKVDEEKAFAFKNGVFAAMDALGIYITYDSGHEEFTKIDLDPLGLNV